MDLSEEAYEKELKELSERYNVPVEMYKQRSPYFVYRYFNADRSINKLLLDYLKKSLIEVIVK